MRKLTLRSLWSHKRRLVATIAAVMLGIGFTAGIRIFTNTLNGAFDDLFASTTADIDTIVQGRVLFESDFGGGDQRANLDAATVDTVRAVDGVRQAEPYVLLVTPNAQVLDRDGHALGSTTGAPTLVESWGDPEHDLNPYNLTDGSRPPTQPGEIALDVAAAEKGGYSLGDTVQMATQDGDEQFTLVGTFLFGEAKSSGGAVSADFSLPEAQRLAGISGDEITQVIAVAADGVSDTELTQRIQAALPADGSEAVTGTAYGEEVSANVSEGFNQFSVLLQAFASIALLVGIFIIYNTFQILVAQRTRELALLRAVGASKGQVARSVLLEALVIGLVASAAGIVFGVGLAALVLALFSSGGELPISGLGIDASIIVSCLITGTIITLIAAAIPAWRSIKVPPLAALRDVAIERPARRSRLVIGANIALLSALQLSKAWSDDPNVGAVASGFAVVLVAAIVLGPALAGPTSRVLGTPLPRFRGVTGRLAVENAARSPKRTAATAGALVVSVALVGFVSVLGASIRESVDRTITRGLAADIVVQGGGGFGPPTGFSPDLQEQVRAIDDVQSVSAISFSPVNLVFEGTDDGSTFIQAIDPATILDVFNPIMVEGDLSDLSPDGLVVDTHTAQDNGIEIGEQATVTAPGGQTRVLTVEAISDDQLLAPYDMSSATYAEMVPEALDGLLFVKVADGGDVSAIQTQIEDIYAGQPFAEVLDREAFIGSAADQINQFVRILYILLALSVIVAVIGIANTLSLSIHERTREIGLLRAIGSSRDQVRGSFRWEAAIVSVMGTMVGLVVGLIGAYALVKSLGEFGLSTFVFPLPRLVVIAIVFIALGVLASLLPSRRAAKLDILDAIAQS